MTAKINCPACGAGVPFQSNTSITATCAFCRSVLLRTDIDVKLIGKVGQVMDDVTLLQIATQGKYNHQSFILLGRARWRWDDGFWNEWNMAFGGGVNGWLGEAQGQLYPCMYVEPEDDYTQAKLAIGHIVRAKGKSYEVTDLKTATCIACEGELPAMIAPGSTKFAADCRNDDGGYACVEIENAQTRMFIGTIEDVESMRLSNLRTLDGW